MIVTRTVDYEVLDPSRAVTYTLVRQNWREWFSYMVSFPASDDWYEKIIKSHPWHHFLYRRLLYRDYSRAVEWYQIVPLCFLSDAVWLFNERIWYPIGINVMRSGYLNLPPMGERISWFWPRYFTFPYLIAWVPHLLFQARGSGFERHGRVGERGAEMARIDEVY
jgi:hypothetical protein